MRRRLYHAATGRRGQVVGRPEVLEAYPELESVWEAADQQFPIGITRSWWERMRQDPSGALARQALPAPQELTAHEGDLADPVGDALRSPVSWVVHKYPDRVLWLVTKRCHLYCRYCFRRGHDPESREDPTPEAWERAVHYIRESGAREVILSGGDPLAISDARLDTALQAIKTPSLRRVRIHTRAPITYPRRVTAELVDILKAHRPLWVVVHVNHPRELNPDVDEALARLTDAGLPVLNQAVLLKGVNDDPAVLAELCEALVDRHVRPYHLHHTDAAVGNATFRVSVARGLAIVEALRTQVSGLAFPRYVIDPPDGQGKRDVDAYVRQMRV
ncbi:MAG: KamA family radical SAM protein [Myxococcota bacterium]